MRIFTSQKNRKQIVSLIVDFFLEELTVTDPLLCVSFSSTSFHLIPIKTNRWFNIKFDWVCSTTYLEIRCCKNPKISLLTTTSETFSFATSTFSLTVSLTSENETKVYMNIWMDGYMLFFSVTANWQHITTVAGFFLYLVIQLTIYSGFLFLLRVLKVIQKWFGLIKTSLKAMFSFHTLILKWFIWVRVYKSTSYTLTF